MGKCSKCQGEFDYIPGIGICIGCRNAMNSTQTSSSSTTTQRSTESYKCYTDQFGNKVRIVGSTGNFEVKTGFWGWSAEIFKGRVEYRYPNGDLYVGEVHGQYFNGKGKMFWKSTGNTYEGDWAYGYRSGRGRFTWANGTYYEGDYVSGKCHGNGVRTYIDGYTYKGQFKDGVRHGKGILISPDGTAVEYYYENDKVVRKTTESAVPIPPKTTAIPRTDKKTTVTAEVKKTETVTPIVEAKASSDDIEFWNKLVNVKSDQKRKEELLASHPIVVIPEGTKRIPGYLFDKSLNLKGVHFNSDIAEIGMWDFRGCKNLGPVVVIPKGVKKIYSYAFENCNSLKKVVLPNNITIDRLAFVDSGITEVDFETEPPRGVVIGYGAFKHCDKHMSKEMKEKIKRISSNAFK